MIARRLAGAGKSALAGAVAGQRGVKVLNGDRIRRNLAGLPAEASARVLGSGIYTAEWTERTYAELLHRAAVLLAHGKSVTADVSFASAQQRAAAAAAAADVSADLVQLRCTASRELGARRMSARTNASSDADQAIVPGQTMACRACGCAQSPETESSRYREGRNGPGDHSQAAPLSRAPALREATSR